MFLTILKIIGIILLVILLLIIFILALVLLIPIKYRFSAEYFDSPDVLATVRYALIGLNAQVSYKDTGLQYTIRALGGVVMTNTDAKLSWIGRKLAGGDGKADAANDEEESFSEGQRDDLQNIDDGALNLEATNEGTVTAEHQTNDSEKDMHQKDRQGEASNIPNNKKSNKDKRPLSEKINEKIDIIKEKYENIKIKLLKLNKKKDGLIKVYKSKRFEVAKADVIRYIKEILRAIKPKHVEGRIHFGMNDPASTGEILGGLATFLPLYDGFLDIRPDFEKQVIEGLINGYGKIRLWSFAKLAIKVLLNKNLIKVVKRVQTIAEA